MAAYYKIKTKEELEKIVNESKTLAEVMRKLGYSANRGNSIKGLKNHLTNLGIDFSKFSNNFYSHSHPQNKIEDILIENSTYSNMTSLKKRIIHYGFLKNECYICGIKEWRNKPLVLQLDHINGNNRDNRIENLRLLCPNCHSQTDSFCRKKK